MKIQLSEDQHQVVHQWGQGMAVVAGAGSGKTTTMVMKCQALLEKNPQAAFAAVSFTEKSTSDLKRRLSQSINLGSREFGLQRHWVTTIHGLCRSVIQEFPQAAGIEGGESILSEFDRQKIWDQAVESLWLNDRLPDPVERALQKLSERENRQSICQLLLRCRSLVGFDFLLSDQELLSDEPDDLKSLKILARFVVQKFQQKKDRLRQLDFDDLEIRAKRCLKIPAVQKEFWKRFDLVLVDEFQDTNSLQAEIIWNFVRPDRSNLCVVGDPKQSIYRFRDADVTVFEERIQQLPLNLELKTNYRSRPEIIDFVNDVCAPCFEESDLSYQALVPGREATDDGFDPVEIWDIEGPENVVSWVLEQRSKGIALDQMALLLRKIRGSDQWLRPLIAAGVPIAVASGGLFWEDPRVRELVAFLKFWLNPSNRLSGLVFLRAPWMEISDQQIDQWAQSDQLLKQFLASDHLVAKELLRLQRDQASISDLLLALFEFESIEQELSSQLLGLWHRCQNLAINGYSDLQIIFELDQAMRQSRRERDVPPPKGRGQLTVLTLHGSKGLEFDHVLLVNLSGKTRAADAPLLFWDRVRGSRLSARKASGERDLKDPEEISWRDFETQKNLAESKRLFYVALTRAKKRLALFRSGPPAKEKEAFPPEIYRVDDWRGWINAKNPKLHQWQFKDSPLTETSIPKIPALIALQPPPSLPVRGPQYRPRHGVTEWNLLARCPKAYALRYLQVSIDEAIQENIQESIHAKIVDVVTEQKNWGAWSPSELGTAVHRCIEIRDWIRLEELAQEVGADRLNAQSIIDLVESETPPLNFWNELSFEIGLKAQVPEVLIGSIDRLEEVEAGVYRLIDYKILSRQENPESILEKYRDQLWIYHWAVQKLLNAPDLSIAMEIWTFSPEGAQKISLCDRPGEIASRISHLHQQAQAIVSGQEAKAQPGKSCRYCEFKNRCPEGGLLQSAQTPSVVGEGLHF